MLRHISLYLTGEATEGSDTGDFHPCAVRSIVPVGMQCSTGRELLPLAREREEVYVAQCSHLLVLRWKSLRDEWRGREAVG